MDISSKQCETVTGAVEKRNMDIRLENANFCSHGNHNELENMHFTV